MRKFLVFTAAAIMVATLTTPNAFAQRDAGAKARGDMTNFWGPHNERTSSRGSASVRRMRVMPSAGESYRRFSYVPAAPSPGAVDSTAQGKAQSMQISAGDVQSSAVAAQPQQYRRFSYQPRSVSSQRNQVANPPWKYLKMDPRRHTP